MKLNKFVLAGLALLFSAPAFGQALSTGKVTTAAPTYTNGAAGALSLDTSGNLRVVTSGGGGGTSDVNLVEIDGVAVSNTTPGTFDVTCIAGCVAGSGVVNGEATTAAPTYIDGTDNPLSLDLAGNLRVLVGNTSIAVTQSGTWNIGTLTSITNAVDVVGNVASGATDAGDPVKIGAVYNSTLPTLTSGQRGDIQISSRGILLSALSAQNGTTIGVNTSSDGASPAIGLNVTAQSQAWNGTTWDRVRGDTTGAYSVVVAPSTQGDTLSSSAILANSTNSTLVKNAPGTLFEISVYNNSSTIAYLKLYNSASAPTCGSGTPVARYLIPGAASGGAGSNVNISVGKEFTTGISYCVTTGIADADTAAVAATTYLVNLTYK